MDILLDILLKPPQPFIGLFYDRTIMNVRFLGEILHFLWQCYIFDCGTVFDFLLMWAKKLSHSQNYNLRHKNIATENVTFTMENVAFIR